MSSQDTVKESKPDTFPGIRRKEYTYEYIDTITLPSAFKVFAANTDGRSDALYRTYTLLLDPGTVLVRGKSGGLRQVRDGMSLGGSTRVTDERLGNLESRVSSWPNTIWYGYDGLEIRGDDKGIHWSYNDAPETDWDLGPRMEVSERYWNQRELDMSNALKVTGKWPRRSAGCSFDPVLRKEADVLAAEGEAKGAAR